MRTGTLVVSLTASGLLGGVAGALLVQGLEGSHAPPARETAVAPAERDPAVEKEIAALRARIDEMQASVGASVDETAKVRAEFEQEKKTSAESRERLATMEAAGTPVHGGFRVASSSGDLPLSIRDGTLFTGVHDDPALAERMKKVADLRRKSEEERWTAARDALGLSPSQEEELKAALKERNQAIREAVRLESKDASGGDGTAVSVSLPDPTKILEARKKYDDRVGSALNADQAKKWRDDGYESALGGGMRSFAFATIQTDTAPVDSTK